MRKLSWLALLLCALACAAYAEIPCQCGQPECLCFIQLGDEGMAVEAVQNALVAQGYLAPNADASAFDEKM